MSRKKAERSAFPVKAKESTSGNAEHSAGSAWSGNAERSAAPSHRSLTLSHEAAASVGIPLERADDIISLGVQVSTREDLVGVVNSIGYYDEVADHLIEAGAIIGTP